MELFTDASGRLGYGIFNTGHWIANPWPPVLQNRSIQWKELYPIALVCLLWGYQWTGKKLPTLKTLKQISVPLKTQIHQMRSI